MQGQHDYEIYFLPHAFFLELESGTSLCLESLRIDKCSRYDLLFFNQRCQISWCVQANRLSRVWLFTILWTAAHQAPLSMGFSSQEYWSGLPCPPPGDLPDPGIKPISLMFPALAGRFFTASAAWEALESRTIICKESDWTTLSH